MPAESEWMVGYYSSRRPFIEFGKKMFEKVDHIGIVVADLDEATERYERVYGVRCRNVEELPELSVRIAYLPVGDVVLELAEPLGDEGRVAEFLQRNGEGFHHLAYRVDDLEAVLSQLKRDGVRLRDREPRRGGEGSRVAFIEPDETHQVLTELVERAPEELSDSLDDDR